MVYLSQNEVKVGSAIQLTVGPYFFSGVCRKDSGIISSGGRKRELLFEDYRRWLAYDRVYAAFNKSDDQLVGGYRRRRWQHILPHFHFRRHRTWTAAPYTMAQVLSLVLSGPGIETPWRMAYLDANGTIHDGYHPSMNYPIYDLDFERGKSLADLLLDICEATGLIYALIPTETNLFRIVWGMKGVDGPDSVDLTNSDDRESATEFSGHPTRVRIIGDRNVYQIHDITLEPDWNTNWNQFYDTNLLADYIYRNGNDENGVAYSNIADDAEHIIGRQKALSRSLEITVWEFNSEFGAGLAADFRDNHRYQGKCRNDMPASLYIQSLLFRAFRLPSNFFFYNTYGQREYLASLDVVEKLLAGITFDPVTGETFWDMDDNQDGNAFVLVQGYQIGKDMFERVRPDRFNLDAWNTVQELWQKIDVSIQNNNDDQGPTILFDEPVLRCENIVEMVNGFAVLKAAPTFVVPNVKACLTFAAENFSWYQTLVVSDPTSPPVINEGAQVAIPQTHDATLNINGLGGEFIRAAGVTTEVPYWNGKLVRTMAVEYANTFLLRQQIHSTGSFKKQFNNGDTAYELHGKIDRISISHTTSGSYVTVYRTNERLRWNFEPERNLDRWRQYDQLLPGEAEMRKNSEAAYKVAVAARSSKDAYKLIADAFNGTQIHAPAELTQVKPNYAAAVADYTVPAGSIFVSRPHAASPSASETTMPVVASKANSAHVMFSGVSVREGEAIDGTHGAIVRLQKNGRALVRVRGPVVRGDMVKLHPGLGESLVGENYLSTSGTGDTVGKACQAIEDDSVALIQVDIGAGSGSTTGMVHKGEWSADTQYAAQEVVTRGILGEFVAFATPPIGLAPESGLPYWHGWAYPPPGQWA